MSRFLATAALIAFGVVLFTNQESRAAMARFVKHYWKSLLIGAVLIAGVACYSLINA